MEGSERQHVREMVSDILEQERANELAGRGSDISEAHMQALAAPFKVDRVRLRVESMTSLLVIRELASLLVTVLRARNKNGELVFGDRALDRMIHTLAMNEMDSWTAGGEADDS